MSAYKNNDSNRYLYKYTLTNRKLKYKTITNQQQFTRDVQKVANDNTCNLKLKCP